MAETFSTKGLKALLSYPFRQPGWEGKLAILAALCLAGYILPVLPWLAAAGYIAEMLRRAAVGSGEPELPDWQDWSRYFVDGLRLSAAGLLASLPLILFFSCGFGAYFISMVATISVDSAGGDSAIMAPFMFGSWALLMGSIFCGFLITLGIGIPLPAALTHMVVKNSFSALFQVKEWWQIFRANIGGFLIAFILLWTSTFVVQFLTQFLVSTIILCALAFIVPVVFSPYISVLGAYAFGQAYREAAETLALDQSSELPETLTAPPAAAAEPASGEAE